MKKNLTIGLALAVILALVMSTVALASSVDVSVVDVTAPTGSVTLAPGASGSITINMTVTGNQVGTATFDVYRDWTLSGGTFTGSNAQTFTVPPRAAQDPATVFSTSGTVSIDSGQAAGTFTLAVSAFNITNDNQTGAKLSDGSDSSYQVTVTAPPPPSDTTPPTIDCTVPDQTVWYGADVTVNCTASDSGSGLKDAADASFSLSTNVSAGDETATASTDSKQVCDNANNCATAGPYTFMVDKKAPTDIYFTDGGITDGGSYYFGFVPAGPTTCTATDLGSGLASCVVTGGGTTVGAHSFVATATDNVGNSDTASLNYTVLAWTLKGFYAPVDMNGVFNVAKAGSTIPLKFEIFADTELTDTAYVKSLKYGSVACDATAPQDTIETVATGGTVLRYDTTAGQFVYNWKTPSTPGCYSVTVTMQDGSPLSAFFRLK